MRRVNKRMLLHEAGRDLYDRLEKSLPSASAGDELAADAFMEAEILIDGYLAAVAAKSDQLPSGPDLALACAHVLVATSTLTQEDMSTLTLLNASVLGVSLYEAEPHVAGMLRRALVALEAAEPAAGIQDSDCDPPF